MKLLTVKINGRVERVINFDQKEKIYNNTYIIRRRAGVDWYDLFQINPCNYLAIAEEADDSSDGKISIGSVEKDTETDRLKLVVCLETGRQTLDEVNCPPGIKIVPDKIAMTQTLKLSVSAAGNDIHHIELCLEMAGKEPSLINMYLEDYVYDAMVDFGSEASQAHWKKGTDDSSVNIVEGILDEMQGEKKTNGQGTKEAHVEKPADINDYVQYEYDASEESSFYRSIYYIKKELDSDCEIKSWPQYNDGVIKYLLSTKTEIDTVKENFCPIPNTKLLNFQMRNYANYKVRRKGRPINISQLQGGVIPAQLMNNVIFQTLKEIDISFDSMAKKGQQCSVVLNVLMPNVYPVHLVAKKLNQLSKDLMDNKNKMGKIRAIELRYISESDASLLGYANKKGVVLQPGNYLIIDAGKGTTDFSLMEVSSTKKLTNKSRGGIVGAGAAITYGVLVGMVNEYLNECFAGFADLDVAVQHNHIRKFVFEKIIKADVAVQNKVMRKVEEYKVLYNKMHGDTYGVNEVLEVTFNDIMGIDLENGGNAFIPRIDNWIKNGHKLSEKSAKYVSAEIDRIVAEVMFSIKNGMVGENDNGSVAQYVVFTGRGCLMRELREKLKKELVRLNVLEDREDNEIVPLNTMKRGCMKINQLLITGQYDTAESRQAVTKKYGVKPDVMEKKGPQRGITAPKNRGFFEKIGDKISVAPYDNKTMIGSTAQGVEIGRFESSVSKIDVGGWEYNIDSSFQEDGSNCKVYFDGIYYIVVSDNSSIEPQVLNDDYIEDPPEANLVFESLFPNINVDGCNASMVIIPEYNCQEENNESAVSDDIPKSEEKKQSKAENQSADAGNEELKNWNDSMPGEKQMAKIKEKTGKWFGKFKKQNTGMTAQS